MPDFESFWQYEDKIKEYYLLDLRLQIPKIPYFTLFGNL